MKIKILLITLTFFLTSCLGTKRYNDFVNQKYSSKKDILTNTTSDYISFKTDSLKKMDTLAITRKVKEQFIPAILYWQWESTLKCDINPAVTSQTFCNNFIAYADLLNLKEKLNGQKLEISIDDIPSSFTYSNKGGALILIVAYTVSDIESIYPENTSLKISYRLLQNNKETKTGSVMIINKDIPVKNIWKSTKKFTWTYLDQYENNLKILSKDAVNKLLTELIN